MMPPVRGSESTKKLGVPPRRFDRSPRRGRPNRVARSITAFLLALGGCTCGPSWVALPVASEAFADSDPCDRLLEQAIEMLTVAEQHKSPQKAAAVAKMLEEAEARCPDIRFPFWAGRAWAYAADYDRAIAALRRTQRLSDASAVHALFLESEIHYVLGKNPNKAIDGLLQVRARDRNFLAPQVSILLWKAYLDTGNAFVRGRYFEDAIKRYQRAILEAGPSTVRADSALAMLAQAFRFNDQWSLAQEKWEDLVKRYPNDARFRYGLAGTYSDQFMYPKAIEQWTVVIRLIDSGQVAKEDVVLLREGRMRYGVCLGHLKKYEEGRQQLLLYAKEVPDDPRVYGYLGDSEREFFEDYAKAAEYFVKALAMDPICERYMTALQRLYAVFLNQPDKAAALETILNDEAKKAERKKEMDKRERTRDDATDGCNR